MANLEDSKQAAQQALFDEITRQTEALAKARHQASPAAFLVERLARAYRYAAGGAQPGSGGESK